MNVIERLASRKLVGQLVVNATVGATLLGLAQIQPDLLTTDVVKTALAGMFLVGGAQVTTQALIDKSNSGGEGA